MATRIALDPGLDICPDYTSAAFQLIRTALIAQTAGSTDADAATQLTAAWNTDWDARKVVWAAQVQADADDAEQERLDREALEAAERKETDKKKPKLATFDASQSVPDYLAPRPSNFAKHKLEQFEYCELWYFTIEGCSDADSTRTAQADEAYSLTQTDSGLALQPLSSFRASKRVVRDENLTWAQISIAKTAMLETMEETGWTAGHRTALATFFYALDSHPYRSRKNGEKAVIIYMARVRRHWHDALKRGTAYNISTINEKLLDSIFAEHCGDLQSEKLAYVRRYILYMILPC
ncbi:hypothetical protein B0H13DRAFT_2316690 [Mycena leptocephala]|nr:hypothetical protein B0H13DRAFT_2316690 [Mycena leptocephala]